MSQYRMTPDPLNKPNQDPKFVIVDSMNVRVPGIDAMDNDAALSKVHELNNKQDAQSGEAQGSGGQ